MQVLAIILQHSFMFKSWPISLPISWKKVRTLLLHSSTVDPVMRSPSLQLFAWMMSTAALLVGAALRALTNSWQTTARKVISLLDPLSMNATTRSSPSSRILAGDWPRLEHEGVLQDDCQHLLIGLDGAV